MAATTHIFRHVGRMIEFCYWTDAQDANTAGPQTGFAAFLVVDFLDPDILADYLLLDYVAHSVALNTRLVRIVAVGSSFP